MPRSAFVLVALLAGLLAAGCRVNRPSNDHAVAQTLYDSMPSDPGTFNPVLLTDSASGQAIGDLFEGLVKDNPKTNLIDPDLAQSWAITDGGKTITFHLRHDVKWSDGVPFTARDVLFTMREIYDPHIPNSAVFTLTVDDQPIKAEAPDDYTIVMRLPRPFAPLLYSIGFPIIPQHILGKMIASEFNRAWGVDTPPQKLISLGAYQMERYVPAQQIAFRRYPDYWMREANGAILPRLHGQVLLIVPDRNAQYLRFVGGITDIYAPRPEEVFSLREQAAKLNITIKETGVDTGSLFFAFNRNPRHYIQNGVTDPKYRWFTDINFLRALAHAVDKRGMINLCFRGLAIPAASDVSPENKIFYNPNLTDYDYDLKLAARLLDEAGYRMLRPGVRSDPQGHPLEFNLATPTGDESVRGEMCVIFKQDLEALGIKVNYRPQEFISLVKRIEKSFDWDCILIGFTGGVEPNNGANFLRSSGNLHMWNPMQAKPATPWEAEIDKLLDQGTRVMDPHARAPYYWRIQQILHDQLPLIETVRSRRYIAYRNTLENFDPTVWGTYQPELIQFRTD